MKTSVKQVWCLISVTARPLDSPTPYSYVVISAYETSLSRTLNAAKEGKDSGPLTGTSAGCSSPLCLPAPRPPTAQTHADDFYAEIPS
jgi:hypothetical protein